MKRSIAALAVGIAALGTGLAASAPAHAAVTPRTSTAWSSPFEFAAASGGGCGVWSGVTAGATFFSSACTESRKLEYRFITRTDGSVVMQIAEPTQGYDLKVTGGEWVWEPANSTTDVFSFETHSGGNYLLHQGSHYPGAAGNGQPLKDITPTAVCTQACWGFTG